jgi:hypothetical protein
LTTTPTYGDSNQDGIQDVDGGPWWDGDEDMCGDIETNTQVIKQLQTIRVACVDQDGDSFADISVCASWDNNAGTVCGGVTGAFPGTNSKCSCNIVNFPFSPTAVTMSEMGTRNGPSLPAVAGLGFALLLGLASLIVVRGRRQ